MALPAGWLPFCDRREAGRLLAGELASHRGCPHGIVLGLPRGGVPVAAEVADALHLPLDVVVARKLGAPGNPELAIGAVAEQGAPWVDDEAVLLVGASAEYVAQEVVRQRREIAARQRRFRRGHPLALPQRATAIVVDDGIATGATVIAALMAVRALQPARLVLAAPVAPADTIERLRPLADEVVVLATPQPFYAVGVFYDDFRQVTDDEVLALLRAREAAGADADAARPGG